MKSANSIQVVALHRYQSGLISVSVWQGIKASANMLKYSQQSLVLKAEKLLGES